MANASGSSGTARCRGSAEQRSTLWCQKAEFRSEMTRRSHRLAILLLMTPAVGFVSLFLAVVLAMTVLQSVGFFSFNSNTTIGFDNWAEAIGPQTFDLIYSVRTALASAFGSLVIAYPLALYLRRAFAGRGLFNALLRVPLVRTKPRCGVSDPQCFCVQRNRERDPGVRRADPRTAQGRARRLGGRRGSHSDLEKPAVPDTGPNGGPRERPIGSRVSGSEFGAGRFATFRTVLLPLSISGATTAVTLVFIGVLGDYAINSVAGPLYPTALSIRMYLFGKNFGEWGQAGVIAVIIIITSIVVAWLVSVAGRMVVRVAH